jgi:hypothetical protein
MGRTILITLVLLAGWALRAEGQGGVDLARLAGWDIVVSPDAIPSESYAAQEFRTLFAQASGVELPIVTSTDRKDRHVLIGSGPLVQESLPGFDSASLGPEELRIVVRDNLIIMTGGRPRGTLYGVYTFLEDYAGARFLTADHTHVPRLPESSIVGPVDRRYQPPFSFRWSYYGETNRSPMLAARLRVNTVSGDPKYGGTTGQSLINHSFGNQIPLAKYGREHPEYYALRDGKRLSDGRTTGSTPNLV